MDSPSIALLRAAKDARERQHLAEDDASVRLAAALGRYLATKDLQRSQDNLRPEETSSGP